MEKNPLKINKFIDAPECYGEYNEKEKICAEDCPFKDDCETETLIENENRNFYVKRIDGRPSCFGEYFSPKGPSCVNKCNYKDQCEIVCEGKAEKLVQLQTGAPRMNVLNDVWNKPTTNPLPNLNNLAVTVPQRQPQQYTQEQMIKYYGVPLKENPLVPGQFEGESWYSRLGKEFVLHSGSASIKILSELFITLLSRIRWAPNAPKN